MSHYSFRAITLRETNAHSGRGVVRTARVADERSHSGFNFIDMTEIPPGHSIGLHRHGKHDEEVYVVVSGSGEMTLGGATFAVHPGDVVVNPPGGAHGLRNTEADVLRIVVLDVPARSRE